MRSDAASIAEQLVDALCVGDTRTAMRRFGDAMRAGLPEDLLRRVWIDHEQRLGPFRARLSTRTVPSGDGVVAIVRTRWSDGYADVQVTVDADGVVQGLFIRPAAGADEQEDRVARARLARSMLGAAPLILAVPVAYALAYRAWGLRLEAAPALVGAAGWSLALALRVPVGIAARRLRPASAHGIVVGSSGPLEEGLRLGALLMMGRGFETAFSLGLGWAAVEVAWTLATAARAFVVARGSDVRAMLARDALAGQAATTPRAPYIGVIERTSATAFHIGAALILARYPLLVGAAMVTHSALNRAVVHVKGAPWWVPQIMVFVVGALALYTGLSAFGRI